jgi:hypothetical protein
MAVNFGDTILEGGIEPAAKVQKPVQDDSGAVLANAMAPVAAGIGEMLGGIFKGQQENSDNLILNRFEEELSTLADAVEQGQLDPTNVMSHARHIRAKYLSNAPNLRDKLDGAWTHFANATGVGHVLIQGTPEQQADQALTKAAIAAGYDNVDQYKRVLASENELKRIENDVKYLQAQGNVVLESQKNQFIQTATSLANNAYPAARNTVNRAIAAMDAASTPTERAAIAQQITSEIRTTVADMKNITGGVGAEYITAPIEDLLKLVDDYAKGTVTTEVLKGTVATTQATLEAMVMSNPDNARWIATSKILREAGYSEAQIHAEMLRVPGSIEIMRNLMTEGLTGNLLSNSADTNQTAATATKILGSNALNNNPEVVEEVRTMLNGIVDDSYNLERIAKDGALGWKPVVTILGSPEAAEWVRKNGPISATNKAALSEVLGKHYTAELLPTIRSFWDESTIPTPGMQDGVRFAQPTNIKANDALEPVWNGSVVEFVPKAGFENNPSVRAMADEMNMGSNSIGIPLNDIIRADALLTGQDAKTVWEERFARQLFNAEPPSIADRVNKALDGDDNDGFSMGDFNPMTLEPVEEYVTQDSALTQLPPLEAGYASESGIDFDKYLPSIRAAESGGNDSAKNPTSTATGRYQFLTSTWNGLVDKYPNSGLTKDGRLNGNQQEIAIRLFTAENGRSLRNAGINLNNGTLYAAHFLGASDAVKVLSAPGNTPIESLVAPKVIQANGFLRGMDANKFRAWANRKGNLRYG